ncbi:hypothetical protein FLM55_02790 [Francisella sp. Scap27]|uniref:hypothetical protein n=1 Tax=Francisella sp. Scap27 TaxID=2589986 RepID=UPI0015BA4EA2|nr:hypothetical protein [Francisella sp. Scap27]QLE78726.1 hypothetical protein FLM55_02790 [Francisella sp. Scap27]
MENLKTLKFSIKKLFLSILVIFFAGSCSLSGMYGYNDDEYYYPNSAGGLSDKYFHQTTEQFITNPNTAPGEYYEETGHAVDSPFMQGGDMLMYGGGYMNTPAEDAI